MGLDGRGEGTGMKIAYSCAGEGMGHAARMVCLGPWLEQRFEVIYYVPASVRSYVEARLPGRQFRDLPWFQFEKKGDRVLYWKTFFQSLRQSFSMVTEVLRLSRALDDEGVTAVLSDYDPYLAWAGRQRRRKVVQFNHPGVILKHFSFDPRCWAAALVGLLMEGPWTTRVHVSFYDGDVGPLIRPELLAKPKSRTGPWLLHLKEEYRPLVLPALERAGLVPYDLFPRKGGDFDAALARSRGVISSAGHQIISEALVLGKPILVVPQRGQYEQTLNAKKLARARRGVRASLLTLEKDLIRYKNWAEKYAPLGSPWKDETARAVEQIAEGLGLGSVAHDHSARREHAVALDG
jgi:hypothetical protein